MPLPSLSVVRLTTNAYRDCGLVPGDLGTILEVYDDKYEVDFSRPETGETIAWLALPQNDVELALDPNATPAASPANAEAGFRPGDGGVNLAPLTNAELLALWADAMTELKSRGVIRSANNPVADYAERLVADRLGLVLKTGSNPGYDAVGPDGTRYQIKARRTNSDHFNQVMGAIRGLDSFNFLVVVHLGERFELKGMWQLPIDLVREHAKHHKHVNAHILYLSAAVLNDPRAVRLV